MEVVDRAVVVAFLERLGDRQTEPARLLLLGGSALLLLGNTRATADIDYVGEDVNLTAFQKTIDGVPVAAGCGRTAAPITATRVPVIFHPS